MLENYKDCTHPLLELIFSVQLNSEQEMDTLVEHVVGFLLSLWDEAPPDFVLHLFSDLPKTLLKSKFVSISWVKSLPKSVETKCVFAF